MTRLDLRRILRRETAATSRGKALVVELSPFTLAIRVKGKRWKYDLSYESIFQLGAEKEAERLRRERNASRRSRKNPA